MTAQATVEAVINNAITQANTAAQSAQSFSNQAATASQILLNLGSIVRPTRPDIALPPFNPNEDLGAEFTLAFDNAVGDFDDDFKKEIKRFFDNWFPDWRGCLKNIVDPWICSTIQAGGVGLPAEIERAIWAGERERELIEVSRLDSEAIDNFAAMGWSLPGGALIDERAKVREAGANRIAEASRSRAIKNAEIRIEMLKFAVEKGVELRLGVLNGLVNFLNAWLRIPALAIDKARILTEAKTKLWEQSAAYYRALIAEADLLLHYDEIRINSDLHEQDNFVRSAIGALEQRVNGLIAAAEVSGRVAGSFASSTNSLASIDNSTIESGA